MVRCELKVSALVPLYLAGIGVVVFIVVVSRSRNCYNQLGIGSILIESTLFLLPGFFQLT